MAKALMSVEDGCRVTGSENKKHPMNGGAAGGNTFLMLEIRMTRLV